MSDLTTLGKVKAWMGISNTADDVQLERLITAVSEYIQTWLNRTIASKSYVDVVDGHGGSAIMLSNYPVTAVASVVVDGQPVPVATSSTGPGYRFNSTMIVLNGYAFTRGFQNVTISYTAGYAATPPEIEQACIELVALRYKERDRIGQQSKAVGGEVVSFITKDFSDPIKTILNNYRKVVPT